MRPTRTTRAIVLIELLVYLGALFVLLNAASVFYYRYVQRSVDIARNANDIRRVTAAGERWRSDVRQAVAVRASGGAEPVLTLEQPGQVVRYRFAERAVWRKGVGDGAWVRVLAKVKASRTLRDVRHGVVSWRWELELLGGHNPRVRPLFTFRAVPRTRRPNDPQNP